MCAQVEFDTHLDLGPVMSNRRSAAQLYELYGVIVHVGHSLNAGHYFCFVRAANGLWHRMDDAHVSQVPLSPVHIISCDCVTPACLSLSTLAAVLVCSRHVSPMTSKHLMQLVPGLWHDTVFSMFE